MAKFIEKEKLSNSEYQVLNVFYNLTSDDKRRMIDNELFENVLIVIRGFKDKYLEFFSEYFKFKNALGRWV